MFGEILLFDLVRLCQYDKERDVLLRKPLYHLDVICQERMTGIDENADSAKLLALLEVLLADLTPFLTCPIGYFREAVARHVHEVELLVYEKVVEQLCLPWCRTRLR